VKDYPEIEATIEEATNHRTVGSTLMNATSSRAHTVQIIEFKQAVMMGGKEQVKISMINLVDLAGSEKAGQTGASGDRLKEGAAINKSLSALGNVIEKLAEKSGGKGKNVIIPYRDSKLTRLLQNALGGSSKTIMICALSPASSNYEETLSTLRYADRAKKIKNTATVNENPQDRLLRELKEENQKLKEMMEQMQKGMVDTQAMEAMAEKQQEIQDVEKELREMQKSFDQRVAEAKIRETEQKERRRRTTLGLVRSGIAVPQLVNLNEDPQLTGRIKYSLEPAVLTNIRGQKSRKGEAGGSSNEDSDDHSDSSDSSDSSRNSHEQSDSRDIMLLNDSVFDRHASIYNEEGACYLYAEHKSANHTFVNGVSLEAMAKQNGADEQQANKGRTLGSIIKRGLMNLKEKENEEKQNDAFAKLDDPENPGLTQIAESEAMEDLSQSEQISAGQADQGVIPVEPEPCKQEENDEGKGNRDEEGKGNEEEEGKSSEAEEGKGNEDEKSKDEKDKSSDSSSSSSSSSGSSSSSSSEDEKNTNKSEDEKNTGKSEDAKNASQGEDAKNASQSEDEKNTNKVEDEKKKQKMKEREMLKEKHKKEGYRLKHADRVVFGKCFFFFVVPGDGVAEVMIMSGVVDFQMASKEMRKMRLKNAAFKIAGGGGASVSPMDLALGRKLSFKSQPTGATVRSRNTSLLHAPDEMGGDSEDGGPSERMTPRNSSATFSFFGVRTEDFDNISNQSESEMEETILSLRAQLAQSAAALSQQENIVRLQAEEILELRAMLSRVGVPELAQPPSRLALPAQEVQLSPQPSPSDAEAAGTHSPRTVPSSPKPSPCRNRTESISKQPALVKHAEDAGLSQHVAGTFQNALGSLEKVELALISLMNSANKPALEKKSANNGKDVVHFEAEKKDLLEVEPEGFDV